MEAYQLAQRLQSMVGTQNPPTLPLRRHLQLTASGSFQRTRKRRVRDTWGNWCDSKDLEGQTYEVWTDYDACSRLLVARGLERVLCSCVLSI